MKRRSVIGILIIILVIISGCGNNDIAPLKYNWSKDITTLQNEQIKVTSYEHINVGEKSAVNQIGIDENTVKLSVSYTYKSNSLYYLIIGNYLVEYTGNSIKNVKLYKSDEPISQLKIIKLSKLKNSYEYKKLSETEKGKYILEYYKLA